MKSNSVSDYISVQSQDFDLKTEYQALTEHNQTDGAVVTFVGLVRDFNEGKSVTALHLEHYPAMAERSLQDIVAQARTRWSLGRIRVIHRFGTLSLSEQIVFVGVSAKHRGDAFGACEFIMDFLKTRAPFWKKEQSSEGLHWVDAKQSDANKADDWNQK
ncbi:molybdopterin synthase catalytic subunit MoaE [Paraneptunicella aestuarii]|uniref:molybdopterin synthase catalytic subunit MoaE n=1 Tax=Paraneptunicella aestuarii TaxID=2831148 RepID=UPI001E35EB04|nr:molybdopterin synthase catalytic subunit MoaE [Paraneptunicella aestuarii]UAA40553.1 molybdopterin synthase catalytic subunit MoaE [Paraneptunicella aestuarii]